MRIRPQHIGGLVVFFGIGASLLHCSAPGSRKGGDSEPGAAGADSDGAQAGSGQGHDSLDPGIVPSPPEPECDGLECQVRHDCKDGGSTRLRGKVFAPNGTLPLYGAVVYVPNGPLEPLPQGVACEPCSIQASGKPMAPAMTGADGSFEMVDVPSGDNIPLVVQIGKWRRQVILPHVEACATTELTDPELTRLPKNQSEGNIPRIAVTHGQCDTIQCILPLIGLDDNEFGSGTDGPSKSVHLYATPPNPYTSTSPESSDALWTNLDRMKEYDLLIFSCECTERIHEEPPGPIMTAVNDYLNAGGRVFTSDYGSQFFRQSPDASLRELASWEPQDWVVEPAPAEDVKLKVNNSFPKGKIFTEWYGSVRGDAAPASEITVEMDYPARLTELGEKATVWAATEATDAPRWISFNTPIDSEADEQCGKVHYMAAHVHQSGGLVVPDYPRGCFEPNDADYALIFGLFDLAACVQDETKPPETPVVR